MRQSPGPHLSMALAMILAMRSGFGKGGGWSNASSDDGMFHGAALWAVGVISCDWPSMVVNISDSLC